VSREAELAGPIVLLAPMRPELVPLARRLALRREGEGDEAVYRGTLGGQALAATLTGIGTQRAARVTERILDAGPVRHVVVVGVAGGVDPALGIGDVVVPERVVDHANGREHRPAPLGHATPRGTIMTTDELFTAPDVHAQLAAEGVVALDMETAAVAAVCERRGCPWSVFRAISDRNADQLVDEAILGLSRPDGRANLAALARYLLPRPWRARRLARLGRDLKVATEAAADAAAQALQETRRPPRRDP